MKFIVINNNKLRDSKDFYKYRYKKSDDDLKTQVVICYIILKSNIILIIVYNIIYQNLLNYYFFSFQQDILNILVGLFNWFLV